MFDPLLLATVFVSAVAGGCCIFITTRSFAFPAFVCAAVLLALQEPAWLIGWNKWPTTNLIVPLIQIIMFGMGTTLSVADFLLAFQRPLSVIIGLILQYTVMPVLGYLLAVSFEIPAEVAAGVVLTGACSGGVSSNLMTFLAKGNVALSVTMTALSTLCSPFVTPWLMQFLAGTMIAIKPVSMMLAILNMIITPIVAGVIAHKLLYQSGGRSQALRLLTVGLSAAALLSCLYWLPAFYWSGLTEIRSGLLLGTGLIMFCCLLTPLLPAEQTARHRQIDNLLSLLSMAGICLIIAIIVAHTRQTLMQAGWTLLCIAMLHNSGGYLLGYWLSRACQLSEADARTVAFEVGMQNSGMASGLAIGTLKSTSAAIAPALFGPWMNVSGSLLASWWQTRTAPFTEKVEFVVSD